MSSTESRIAVVTGAAKRVGRAIALRLARDGWHLHLTWNRSEAAMKATADKCRQVGAASVVTHQIDLGELAAVSQWAAQLQTQIPSLHGLVHNASRYLPTSWGEVTPAEVEFHFRVNTAAPLLITQALDASLRGAGGSVVAFAD
ncbi:MAG: SDR family NAD(P)-dependent oxidoreductase, partial [Planctomycetota bacterium]